MRVIKVRSADRRMVSGHRNSMLNTFCRPASWAVVDDNGHLLASITPFSTRSGGWQITDQQGLVLGHADSRKDAVAKAIQKLT